MTVAALGHVRVAARLKDIKGNDVVNVFTFENNSGSPKADDTAIDDLDSYLRDLYDIILAVISEDAVFQDLSFWNVEGDYPMGITPWETLTVGGAVGDDLPSQISGFVYFRTHKSRCIGKKFVGPFVEGSADSDGTPSATLVGLLQDWGDFLVAGDPATGPDDWDFVILSSTDGLYYKPYQALVPKVWSTLRRRRIGRGS